MRNSLFLKSDLKRSIKFHCFSLLLISLIFANLNPLPKANAAANPLEILSVTEVSDTSVEILFNSKISKSKINHYVITAAFDQLATNTPENTNFNSSNLIGSSVKKVLKVKSTGLISTKLNNLSSKAPYIFTVSAQMNQGKFITSESVNYFPLSNLIDAVANLPADWGNPKPIQLPTPAPTSTPLAAPAFTLSSSSETRTVNTAATGFTVSSTGGAIASFAINATPPGMSFNTSTGALTGTPNTVAGATAYTITGSNASGSASQTFTLTVSIAAPAFTLSSASESKTVNTAITGYTISSTGGTIASYAISPAAPAGLTFNTTTGLLSGTPTTVAGATNYTITATNASGSATQTFTLTVTAAVYSVGQTGPGGGKIFYVAATPFACGPTRSTTCRYLEAAPTGWQGAGATNDLTPATNRTWSPAGQRSGVIAPQLEIGWGYQHSVTIAALPGSDTTNNAAKLARSYSVTIGSITYNDWFLPSKDELNEMFIRRVDIGLSGAPYFSSTDNTNIDNGTRAAYSQSMVDGTVIPDAFKYYADYVRPIRAFE